MTDKTNTKPESRDEKIARGMARYERYVSHWKLDGFFSGKRKIRFALALASEKFDDPNAHVRLQFFRSLLLKNESDLRTMGELLDAMYEADRD